MIKKKYYSWADVEKMCVSIVNKMYADNWRPDYIVGITRGGNIPATIIQGRYDVCTPISTAWELHKNWPEAKLIITPFSGHSAFEKEITHELILATNKFASID